MGVSQSGHGLVLFGKLGEVLHHLSRFFEYDFGRLAQNDNVGIVAHIAACRAEVDDRLRLRALLAVGIDMAHNVVADYLLARLRDLVIDVVLERFKLRYLLVADVEAELLLCLRQGDPKPSPCAELEILGKDELHFRACVSCGKRRYIIILLGHFYSPY